MGYHGKKTYKYDLGKICGHSLSVEIEAHDDKEAEQQIFIVRKIISKAFEQEAILKKVK